MARTTKSELAEQLREDGHEIDVRDETDVIKVTSVASGEAIRSPLLPGRWHIAAAFSDGILHLIC